MDSPNQEGRRDASSASGASDDREHPNRAPIEEFRADPTSGESHETDLAAAPLEPRRDDPENAWSPGGANEPTPSGWEFAVRPAEPNDDRSAKGLGIWLAALAVFGVGGLFLGIEELAFMTAIAGLFVVAQAADIDARWRYLHYAVTWVVPACGVMAALVIGYQIFFGAEVTRGVRMLLAPALLIAALACILSTLRPVANLVARLLFRVEQPSHTLRLAARITLAILVLALPGWYALRTIFDQLFDPATPLLDRASLEGQLLGYVVLAFAAVGLLIRRNWRSTLDRLGVGPLRIAHIAVIALGVVALYGINAAADWIQQTFFHDLWEADHQVNESIAAGLTPARIAVLGLSAGIGEEITMRGALQPKLGLVMTSLLFASLHLQYSWFGMAVIFLLGMLLGVIKDKTNTTAVMALHAIYDVVALFTV